MEEDKKPESKILDMEEARRKKKQRLEERILKKFHNHSKNLGW